MFRSGLQYLFSGMLLLACGFSQNLIQGQIFDSKSGQAVTGANITIPNTPDGTTSDATGYFLLETRQAFPVQLTVEHIGYQTVMRLVQDTKVQTIKLIPQTISLEPVDVSVVRLPSHYDVSSAKDLVATSELRTRAVQDFQEVTRGISSVVVSTKMNGSQTISVRGSNANETPVYLDGVKLNDSFTNIADLSQISMESVASIEVVKGAATLPYELGAFGGVVNIYSLLPTENQIVISNSNDLNQSANFSRSGQINLVRGPCSTSAWLTKRSRKYPGFSTNTLANDIFGEALVNWKFKQGNLHLNLRSQKSQAKQSNATTFETSSVNRLADIRYTGSIYKLGSDWQLSQNWREDDLGVAFWSLGTKNPAYEQAPSGHQSSYRVAKLFTRPAFETLCQIAGGLESYDGPSSTAIPPVFTKEMTLKIQQQTHSFTNISKYMVTSDNPVLGKLVFEFGLRYDDVHTNYDQTETRRYFLAGEDTPYRTEETRSTDAKRHYLVAKRLGLRMEGQAGRLAYVSYLSLGNNNRLPTLQDEYFKQSSTIMIYQDQVLVPEQVNSSELGLDFRYDFEPGFTFARLTGQLNSFNNGFINKLTYKTAPAQPPTPYNTLSASISGIEVAGKFVLPNDRGSFDLGSTFLSLSDPNVFIGKPSYRHTLGLTLKLGVFRYTGNMWWDGRTIYSSDAGLYQEPKHNLDVAVDYHQELSRLTITSTLAAKNIFNLTETREALLVNDQGFLITYYDQFQLVLSLRFTLH